MSDLSTKPLLAIDTSSSQLRLALRFGEDRLVKSAEDVERAHGQMIMRKIDNLTQSGGIAASSLGGIAVCTGPGSFTGLRVGIAVAKGMAVALEIPVVGVSLFEVAAFRLSSAPGAYTVLVFQRKGEYLAAYVDGDGYQCDSVSTRTIEQIQASATNQKFVTIGPLDETLRATCGQLIREIEYDASDLISLAEPRLSGGGDNLDTLEPHYFGKSQAEIRFDQRHQKN